MIESITISVIIPVLNEADILKALLLHLQQNSLTTNIKEIIVVDGGSTDSTIEIAKAMDATVIKSKRGRACQMNMGAKNASGTILYFLHADTLPPKHFDKAIIAAHEKGFGAGCFRMQFDTKNWALRFFAYLSKINHTLCRGGDQSLFVSKEIFDNSSGFNENYLIYEDSEFIGRLYRVTHFKVLPQKVLTSARRYRQQGWLKVQFHFAIIHLKNYLGANPKQLYQYYRSNLLN
ncbi:MAG: glycosyltransferase family 2 protein [Croceitalea sp.]|nr:glycosyltransferase family 2 protein [Croceitalea sp.]